MFRKKRMPTKPGYKLMTIKKNGILFHHPSYVWSRLFDRCPMNELDIVGGPRIPIRIAMVINEYDRCKKTFVDYVSEHSNVSIWVPEDYEYV